MTLPPPPIAARRPHEVTHHGVTMIDDWAWLRDPAYPDVKDEDVLSYLRQENAYYEAAMAPHADLVETLFQEMKGRIKEDLSSVPAPNGAYDYWWAFAPGEQYRRWYRRHRDSGAEQCILDEVALADGHEYFRLGTVKVSPDGQLLAYATDVTGSERFTIRFRDLADGAELPERIEDTRAPWGDVAVEGSIGEIVFSADGQYLFYGLVDEHWRCQTIKRHRLGTPSSDDVTVYSEPDPGFSAGVSRSHDRNLIFVSTGDNSSSETYFLPAANPTADLVLVAARRPLIQYECDAAHGRLWIVTNDAHINFRLVSAALASPGEWREEIAGSDRVYLTGATSYRDHLALSTRVDGLDELILRTYQGEERRIPFGEASYSAAFGGNADFAPAAYRIGYSSMVTPPTVFDYHPDGDRLETLRVLDIPSGYDPADYVTERVRITARDGAIVPVSIVRRADSVLDGSGKLFLYGYGAYGIAIPPGFSPVRLSLVDRGFAYAIAHIRGGDDLGHGWYLDGKLEKRTNAFNDFVDVAKGLATLGYAQPGRIAAQGGSAGGELMGAVINQAPELWGAIVADVPFVDVLNTMLDDTLPLTPGEWPEWGNPIEDQAAFELIRSYSPYDNVEAKSYPPMLITGGLNDPRVTYWEPAKWAAKLRATKTDSNALFLKINMGAGHGGKSGRWDSLKEEAEAYAFVLTQLD